MGSLITQKQRRELKTGLSNCIRDYIKHKIPSSDSFSIEGLLGVSVNENQVFLLGVCLDHCGGEDSKPGDVGTPSPRRQRSLRSSAKKHTPITTVSQIPSETLPLEDYKVFQNDEFGVEQSGSFDDDGDEDYDPADSDGDEMDQDDGSSAPRKTSQTIQKAEFSGKIEAQDPDLKYQDVVPKVEMQHPMETAGAPAGYVAMATTDQGDISMATSVQMNLPIPTIDKNAQTDNITVAGYSVPVNKIKTVHAAGTSSRQIRGQFKEFIEKQKIDGELYFKCKFCDFKAKWSNNVKRHLFRHKDQTGIAGHLCSHCGKSFSDHSTLMDHFKNKHMGHRLVCDTCGKMFTTRTGLWNHRFSHRGEFRCTSCGLVFRSKEEFEQHKLTHTRNKVPCRHCGKEFAYKYTLNKHEVICKKKLDGEPLERFICCYCAESFTRKDSLTTHIGAIHMGTETKACEGCGKEMKYRATYKRHREKCMAYAEYVMANQVGEEVAAIEQHGGGAANEEENPESIMGYSEMGNVVGCRETGNN